MRLTLRTLLAWLDDTLSPVEVREIGKQVDESDFTRELVQRIHRVTRQRRLTTPPPSGPEAVDENVVAAYLDNQLDPEPVAEFEKRCLTSDVHLAEAASVHQILSLIGQKAKVPEEARHRMYHLIKGREAVRSRAPRASRLETPKPVAEPVQPWVTPATPGRPWYERFGPAAAVLGLIGVMLATAYSTLSTTEPAPKPAPNPAAGPAVAVVVPPAAAAKPTPEPAAPKPVAVAEKAPAKDERPAAKPDAVPTGSAGLARKSDGVLLRYNPDQREWLRLTDATPLRDQDRLLGLDPFRSAVEVGTAEIDLVGETEVWVHATLPTQAARLSLVQGRVVLHATTPSLPFEIQYGGKTVALTPPPGSILGVERLARRAAGEPKAQAAALRVHATRGPLRLAGASPDEVLGDAGSVTIGPDGAPSDSSTRPVPGWVTETEPLPYDKNVGVQFARFLRPDRPILSSLVEASEDEQKDVRRKAIAALRAVGDISYVAPLLNRRTSESPNAMTDRKAAAAVLREDLAESPEAAAVLHANLMSELGDALGPLAEKLLVGYTPKEAGEEATYSKLVAVLGNPDPGEVGLRELALENLMTLTGRDDLGYDPEKPEGKGLKAWRDLLHGRELRSAAAKKAAK